MRRLVALAVAALAAALLLASPASASRFLRTGIFDDAHILDGDPATVFPTLAALRAQMIRVDLWWGGAKGVATRRPDDPADPADPAYDWSAYDRVVENAQANGIAVMFTIIGTPPWANDAAGVNVAPASFDDLQAFAQAAARRYDGTFLRADGTVLPRVRYWTAWNEPNNPVFLRPQFRLVGSSWVMQGARDYAQICNAIVTGLKSDTSFSPLVACGVTAPRGNNVPGGARSSVSPLAFLRAMYAAGARGFDAYAHHPYYGSPAETPSTRPAPGPRGQLPTAVTLGNLDVLIREVTRLYGNRRIWITEYGYQTNPPDPTFGVSRAKQALYLSQAWTKARTNPRVDIFLWFLLQDEVPLGRWQSGLLTVAGGEKPAFRVFASLRG